MPEAKESGQQPAARQHLWFKPGYWARIAKSQAQRGLPQVTPMVRWIAFDEETADALISRFKRGASELHDGNPLDDALNHGKSSILLMPSSTPGKVLLARIEHKAAAKLYVDEKAARTFWRKREPNPSRTSADSADSISYEPTGFLGLTDEPVFNHPPQPVRPAPKKKWWWRKSA